MSPFLLIRCGNLIQIVEIRPLVWRVMLLLGVSSTLCGDFAICCGVFAPSCGDSSQVVQIRPQVWRVMLLLALYVESLLFDVESLLLRMDTPLKSWRLGHRCGDFCSCSEFRALCVEILLFVWRVSFGPQRLDYIEPYFS